jgi:hypothetical protein
VNGVEAVKRVCYDCGVSTTLAGDRAVGDVAFGEQMIPDVGMRGVLAW